MLTESIAVSSLRPDQIPSHIQDKDVGIYFYDLQSSASLKSTLKKSSTKPNCLATNSTHAFAAQADKAAVHVYNLSKGNQECLVPFPESITSLTLIGESHELGVLALGTQGGNVIFWELATGRQLATQAAHLQSVQCMAVDPTQTHLITGSSDSNVLVWSVPACLSFVKIGDSYSEVSSQLTPTHTLSNHRGPVTCLTVGHSSSTSNFVISGSQDRSCILWNHRTGQLLHTFLLPSAPLCLALDPADRAFYAGFSDGSVQLVDFYKRPRLENDILTSAAADSATEASAEDKWSLVSLEPSEVLAIVVTYDGTRLLTGHQNGQLRGWDVATGSVLGEKVAEVLGPLTNISVQPIKGLTSVTKAQSRLTTVVRPKNETVFSGTGEGSSLIPESYTLNAQFHLPLTMKQTFGEVSNSFGHDELLDATMGDFNTALSHVSLPSDILEEGMISLLAHDSQLQPRGTASAASGGDEQMLKQMREELAESKRSYLVMKERASKLEDEIQQLRREEMGREARKREPQERRLQLPGRAESSQSTFDRVNLKTADLMDEA